MAEEKDPKSGKLDLSELSDLSLGPDWGSGSKPKSNVPKHREGGRDNRDRPQSRPPRQKDRRGEKFKGGRDGPPRERRGSGERSDNRGKGAPFKPEVEVDFYPEEEPFRVLTKAIRTSYRTFELFEIAQLILQKPERFVCVVKDPNQKEGEDPLLFASVPDGLPFRTEDEAIEHVFRHHLEAFFDIREEEGEAPSGNFPMVHKCGITGELIGPPNYHRYAALLKEHHAQHLSRMPFAKFESRLEAVRDEESIAAWLEKMKTRRTYTLKSDPEKKFETLENARLHLLTNAREEVVRPAYSARFSGKNLELLPFGNPIRRSVEYLLEGQKRFPLNTANHIRGRLRRMNFAVYKKGSKGVSYVCAVKRRFRQPGQSFAENLEELISFLEAHPNFPAKDLPKEFLGIESGESEAAPPKAEDMTEEADTAPKESDGETAGAGAAEAPPSGSGTSSGAKTDISKDDLEKLHALKRDLRYLVSEGYVIEYSNGKLFVPPIREEDIRREEKKQEPDTDAKEPEPEAKAPEAEAEAPEPEAEAPEPEAKAPEPEAKAPEPEAKAPEPEAKIDPPETKAEEPSSDPEPKAGEVVPESKVEASEAGEKKAEDEEKKA